MSYGSPSGLTPRSSATCGRKEAAEKGVNAVLRRDDIGRHLTSEMFFSGNRLPGFSDTIEHPETRFEELESGETPGQQLVLELAAPTYLAHVAEVRVPHARS
jgi:hypothetical protein